MHIKVQKNDLFREMVAVETAAERKATIPVLTCVRMEANENGLTLTGTDLEKAIQAPCPATVEEPGVLLLPAKRLLDYIRLLPDEEITIKSQLNDWTGLSCGRSKTRIAGMGAESYPELPKMPENGFSVPLSALLALFRRTSFAISDIESRFTLNGSLLERTDGCLRMVATDGHRLALAETPQGAGEERKFIIPRRAMDLVTKAAASAGPEAKITVASDDNHLFFLLDNGRLVTSRKLSGNFPDYARVLPKSFSGRIVVGRDDFKGAVTRAGNFADERSHAVRLDIKEGELVVSGRTSESGETEEGIEVTGEGVALIGMNAKYLLDFVNVCDRDRIEVAFNNGDSAIQMSPLDDENQKCVLMPLRV
jgi:DNA polymerase-3 subunit beta